MKYSTVIAGAAGILTGAFLGGWWMQSLPSEFVLADEYMEAEEDSESVSVVDKWTVYRNLAYDAGYEDPEKVLGQVLDGAMTPVSVEGQQLLREDSARRLERIEGVEDVIELQALFAAVAMVEQTMEVQELDDDQKAELAAHYSNYGYSLLRGSHAGVADYLTRG